MIAQLLALGKEARGYWPERIVAELEYAVALSRAAGGAHDSLVGAAIEALAAEYEDRGAIGRTAAEDTEARLAPLSAEARSYQLVCAAHAHIDMNWMWRFDETVTVTLDTFRTVLGLMTDYPAFTFSQSQASAYRIVEEHDPGMLDEIRARVKEGRWEVTASTWVEADKNMPAGESLARHALLTKRYLARLLDLDPDTLLLDFEPDTFGHSRHVPEILAGAGVKWYYHCRGYEGHTLYRWRSPSGASVLCYRDPYWYNGVVGPGIAVEVPRYCGTHGMKSMLRVYGIGDHGGGPTRRDIERIRDMDTWPVFPRMTFGSFREFFTAAEKNAARLPVVDHELNPVFDGCYTSQSRIKASNRIAESRLLEAEAFAGLASVAASAPQRKAELARAWEPVLFNHFHDIVTGSGVADTREYALGQFQRAMALASAEQSGALRRIAALVDTSSLADHGGGAESGLSEGAGAGYGVESFGLSRVDRGRGRARVAHVFNPLPWTRAELVELVLWDWPGDPSRLQVRDASGAVLAHQVLRNEKRLFFGESYWGHEYLRVLAPITVPGCGYTTCSITEAPAQDLPSRAAREPRVQHPEDHLLENDRIRALFDGRSGALRSLVDKESGEELVDPHRSGGVFRLVQEDDSRGMTAWIVGRWKSCRALVDGVTCTGVQGTPGLRQWLTYEAAFGASRLSATVTLDQGSPILSWEVNCEWLEPGRKGEGVPQLNFFLPVSGELRAYRFDVPFGTVDRSAADIDLPAHSWVMGLPATAGRGGPRKALAVIADHTHGFRCLDNSISLTLLRSSIDPDPYPELGVRRFGFGVAVVDHRGHGVPPFLRAAAERAHPFSVVSGTPHTGSLPLSRGFLAVEGSAAFSALKSPEDHGGRSLMVRLYETEGKETPVEVRLFAAPSKVWLADLNERPLEAVAGLEHRGETVRLTLAPYRIATLVMEF